MSSSSTITYSSIDMNDMELDSSFFNPNYTYSYDKYSCLRSFYFIHLVFNYFIFLSGLGCFITRIIPVKQRWIHAWLGRTYILCMLWSTASSLLIHNTGLPLATLISFCAVMLGLTIGWIAIVLHREGLQREAMTKTQATLIETMQQQVQGKGELTAGDIDLTQLVNQAKADIKASKTFWQRFFSLETLHGTLFFVSWMQIAGRMFASNQSGDFTCYTYPLYKPLDTPEGDYASNTTLTLVPEQDPNWDRLPWANGVVAWCLQIIFGSMLGALVVSALWNFCVLRRQSSRNKETQLEVSKDVASDSSKGSKEEEEDSHTPDPFLKEEEGEASTAAVDSQAMGAGK